MTNHDLWDGQAIEDFQAAELALFNAVNGLDDVATSYDGVTPEQAVARLTQIEAMVAFALQAARGAAIPTGVSGS